MIKQYTPSPAAIALFAALAIQLTAAQAEERQAAEFALQNPDSQQPQTIVLGNKATGLMAAFQGDWKEATMTIGIFEISHGKATQVTNLEGHSCEICGVKMTFAGEPLIRAHDVLDLIEMQALIAGFEAFGRFHMFDADGVWKIETDPAAVKMITEALTAAVNPNKVTTNRRESVPAGAGA